MPDAFEMIREDHRKVQDLFEEFEHSDESGHKKQIVASAITELKIHAALEEEILYPAVRKEIDDDDTIDEAIEEHHVVKLLIRELESMDPGDERYDAKFTVLAESVKHHIEEEESEVLPKVESSLDGEALGGRIEQRKQQLMRTGGNAARGRRAKARTSSGRRATAGRGRKKTAKRQRGAR